MSGGYVDEYDVASEDVAGPAQDQPPEPAQVPAEFDEQPAMEPAGLNDPSHPRRRRRRGRGGRGRAVPLETPNRIPPPPVLAMDEEQPGDEPNGNVRIDENAEPGEQEAKRRRRRRGGRGRRGRGGSGQGGPPAQGAAGKFSSAQNEPRAAEAEVVQPTGSADRHLVADEPIAPQPVTRPRTYRDLDSIPDDFD
jgi:hypothetical protein